MRSNLSATNRVLVAGLTTSDGPAAGAMPATRQGTLETFTPGAVLHIVFCRTGVVWRAQGKRPMAVSGAHHAGQSRTILPRCRNSPIYERGVTHETDGSGRARHLRVDGRVCGDVVGDVVARHPYHRGRGLLRWVNASGRLRPEGRPRWCRLPRGRQRRGTEVAVRYDRRLGPDRRGHSRRVPGR